MFITIWGVPLELREGLAREVAEHVARHCKQPVRVNCSRVAIRGPGEKGKLRILPTGIDVRGREREIKRIAASACKASFKANSLSWCGYEDPALAGQIEEGGQR